MKYTACFLLLGALTAPAGAQSVADGRAYFRLGGAISQNDMKAYLGDRFANPIYEMGHDFRGPTESTGFGLYVSYLAAHGDPIDKYKGLKQALFGWRIGGDMRFRTPIKGLTPFAGLSVNWYDGIRTVSGEVQDNQAINTQYRLSTGTWPEGKAKMGFRFGAEYRINKNWGVSMDNSVSHWLSRANDGTPAQTSATGPRYYKGINPVAPTWLNVAVQYRWNIWE